MGRRRLFVLKQMKRHTLRPRADCSRSKEKNVVSTCLQNAVNPKGRHLLFVMGAEFQSCYDVVSYTCMCVRLHNHYILSRLEGIPGSTMKMVYRYQHLKSGKATYTLFECLPEGLSRRKRPDWCPEVVCTSERDCITPPALNVGQTNLRDTR